MLSTALLYHHDAHPEFNSDMNFVLQYEFCAAIIAAFPLPPCNVAILSLLNDYIN